MHNDGEHDDVNDLRDAVAAVRAQVDAAALEAGRDPAEVRLLPVSKTVPVERLRSAVAAGMHEFAENKPQEVQRKAVEMSDLPVRWIAIGHLQTNKAKVIAEHAHEFQALDSVRLAEALQRRLDPLDRRLDVLVQVNTSGEDAKTGAAPQDVGTILAAASRCDRLRVRGFMTVASNTDDIGEVRRCFSQLRGILDSARSDAVVDPELLTELSMGMSGDFRTAIAEGATCVRVGTAIFGARDYSKK
ncbi:YggS family pyridoxal phosphate-dependent enzyme [Corynebacterium glyciniphilum]|uniref:Pyridoxal phosphate homeostasis protein n=1 Tax=Corynebacterium glyciniphilum AJ 3170 TaxID=1404245 RepID=X5DWN4_9CORY|nr:YggS family pyridoxal phosphate-dependent enzyme [Corynebacterium glyciniphilum]AHW65032.1 Putative alanine racemase [Corynebacterium glyciniphilum AJ 3170]